MNKIELVSAMSKKLNSSYKYSEDSLDAMLDCITQELINGRKVKLVDFGMFEVAARAPKKGFNPHTREEIDIPACNSPVFRPGKELKEIIKNID